MIGVGLVWVRVIAVCVDDGRWSSFDPGDSCGCR